jgi:hypothetical protein
MTGMSCSRSSLDPRPIIAPGHRHSTAADVTIRIHIREAIMAIGLIFDGVGVRQEQYYQVFNQVTDNGKNRVPGMLSHHAGPTEGGFCVVETWVSLEALQQFFAEQGQAALEAAGIQVQPKTFEIVNSLEGQS